MTDIEKNKALVAKYPFLLPRNVFTDKLAEDYDYSYILGIGEIPKGWNKLFLQMCEDIRKPLIEANYLEHFRFIQIKEKYNRLECYYNSCPENVQRIIDKYSVMSQYICTVCGRLAEEETEGYIASYCRECWKDYVRHCRCNTIQFKDYYHIIQIDQAGRVRKKISFKREWNKYMKGMKNV